MRGDRCCAIARCPRGSGPNSSRAGSLSEGRVTVVLKEVLEIGKGFVLLMEDKHTLVLVDLDLLLGRHLLFHWLLVALLALLVVELALLRAHQALIQQILVLEVVDVLISEPLLAFNMILDEGRRTHRSQ